LGRDSGVSKSTVSRIRADIDREVTPVRQRPLGHTTFPYVFVDVTYVKARIDHQVVSRAVVIATGVTAEGGREVLGVDVGDSKDEVFWTALLTSLKDRGLAGVNLVISDAHRGLQAAIRKTMQGSAWQRCRVHLMRNILSHVPREQAEMVAAFVRTIFAQPDAEFARRQCVRSRPASNAHCPRPPPCSRTRRTT
jgi:putative transposase